jgi:hypothetical protein
MSVDAKDLMEEFRELSAHRQVWENHWQLIGELVHGAKQNFNEKKTRGERINEDRNDPTGVFANRSLASALIGMLWPNGAKSIKLEPVRELSESTEIKEYFDQISSVLIDAMDDPLSGLATVLDEYMLDQGAFGTSGIGVFKGEESLLRFESWGTKQLYISEGKYNNVDIVHRLITWPLRKVVATYGLENLSKSLQDKFNDVKARKDEIEILHIIRPRDIRNKDLKNNQNMPFMSVHMEKDTEHVIRESGFSENPVKVGRFRKLPYEEYGRSPGTDCLSNMLELDYLTGRFTINVDKAGDPPLLVLDDGRLGGGNIDTSSGAISVIDISGRINANLSPVQQLQTVGELSTTLTRMDQLKQSVTQHFFLDKLLDFNNETQMTASEAVIRDRIRGSALGSIFARQTAEIFSPVVTRSFNILLEEGHMGVVKGSIQERLLLEEGKEPIIIPDEVAQRIENGEKVYDIRYFTPAARILQLEELQSINQLVEFKTVLQQSDPSAGDLFDSDEAIKRVAKISGTPAKVIRSQQEVDQERQAQQAAVQQAQEVEEAKTGSEAIKNLAQVQ